MEPPFCPKVILIFLSLSFNSHSHKYQKEILGQKKCFMGQRTRWITRVEQDWLNVAQECVFDAPMTIDTAAPYFQ